MRILVVDDNTDTAQSMGDLLELWHHQVMLAYDGRQALERAAEFNPEVVLLDIGLPGADGYEVARRMRADLGMTEATLIALTGYGREEDRQRASDAGFDLHFTKPVDFDNLQTALQNHMNRESRQRSSRG